MCLNAETTRSYLETVLKNHKIDLLVMEACGPSGWVHDLAESLKIKTIVCSTNEEAWKWSNVKRKTDKDDARKLARMAASEELQPVHMPTATHREFRSLVKYRKTLDGRINKSKTSSVLGSSTKGSRSIGATEPGTRDVNVSIRFASQSRSVAPRNFGKANSISSLRFSIRSPNR